MCGADQCDSNIIELEVDMEETIMRKLIALVLLLGSVAVTTAPVMAQEKHAPAEAIALVKKAIAYLNTNGKEKAIAAFNDPSGQFVNGNLYIFAYDFNGIQLANSSNPKMVGKNLIEMKDSEGKATVKAFIEMANTKGQGWVDYKWPNPATKSIDAKSSYIEKAGDMLVAAGIYK
jgi:cytochrome c